MCTVIVHVPAATGLPVRLLAVRDEDPHRSWDPLGPWWPETHPDVIGVRDSRAGGAWLAADPRGARVSVILNRADVVSDDPSTLGSRGHVVLDAVDGVAPPARPATHGFNLVDADADGVTVTMWDGRSVRTVRLEPGIHMIAHDDVDDPATARIAAWRAEFPEPVGEEWAQRWLDVLGRTAELGPDDDRAIIRDNRVHGYPTLSLLVCAASIDDDGAEVSYGELTQPGVWNRPHLH